MPTADRLVEAGLRNSRFHTTALRPNPRHAAHPTQSSQHRDRRPAGLVTNTTLLHRAPAASMSDHMRTRIDDVGIPRLRAPPGGMGTGHGHTAGPSRWPRTTAERGTGRSGTGRVDRRLRRDAGQRHHCIDLVQTRTTPSRPRLRCECRIRGRRADRTGRALRRLVGHFCEGRPTSATTTRSSSSPSSGPNNRSHPWERSVAVVFDHAGGGLGAGATVRILVDGTSW